MIKKTFILIFAILFVAFGFLVIRGDEDLWICSDMGWIKHGNPKSLEPIEYCPYKVTETKVEEYIKENISKISPTKGVLGGKFYITKVTFNGVGSGKVEYEDGHIALKADFSYIIDNTGSIIIKDFDIIEK